MFNEIGCRITAAMNGAISLTSTVHNELKRFSRIHLRYRCSK